MPQREYEITIEANGTVQLHVQGYKGKSCMDVIKAFEKIVGELKSEQKTGEFYEPDEVVQYRVDQRH
ncbi:MAG: DUF2997 domain-containing protein [Verrucomicrobiota bacterium]|jgi:hypothetical protein|nr:DUF2997 domain-containing protein [Verrucomicrobiota bacterium]